MCALYGRCRRCPAGCLDEDGSLQLRTQTEEDDILYDEIGSVLKIKQLQREKEELFESLEMYYRVFYLGEAYEGEE